MARSLVDTNVLIYSRDRREPIKHARAVELIDDLAAAGDLVVSAQCLNEFCAVALRRGTPVADVLAAIEEFQALGLLLPLLPNAATSALEAVRDHKLSFWDALIWATAREAGIPVVLSEDFQHGRELDGVTFVNPFREA